MNKVIFHIDVNSAFLSWEAVYRLYHLGGKVDLRDEVAAVGGDMAMRHGIILAKSIPAKKYNIKTGESIVEALQKCPQLKLVPPNYSLYERCSAAFMEILRQYSPDVEQYSVDEAFVDMTGTESLWGEPVTAANRIRNQIREELGFTVNVGVSENKLLAKMASDFQKPDRIHTLWKHEIEMKMWPLPVTDLFFVGRATAKKLFHMGIHTIGELAQSDPIMLKSHLKKHGEVIWAFANGMDVSVVQSEAPANKGYGNSTTIAFDVTDASTARCIGLFGALEVVKNKETREPMQEYGVPGPVMPWIFAELKKRGFATFGRENFIEICPPLIITKEELEEYLPILDEVLTMVDEKFCD